MANEASTSAATSVAESATSDIILEDAIIEQLRDNDDLSTSHVHIKQCYGPLVTTIMVNDPNTFVVQRKFRSFFFEKRYIQHAHYVDDNTESRTRKSDKVSMQLIARSYNLDHVDKLPKSAEYDYESERYWADIYAADYIPARKIEKPTRNVYVFESSVTNIMRLNRIDMIEYQSGTPAFVSREEFNARLEQVVRFADGKPDTELLTIVRDAGKQSSALHKYCIAGGSIAKLINPAMSALHLSHSDIDIFVYGSNQPEIIQSIISRLWIPDKTYITTVGSVITIYRVDAMRVQIVSSGYNSPQEIVSHFDFAHIMFWYDRGSVFGTACAICAAITGLSHIPKHRVISVSRIFKLLKDGYHMLDTINIPRSIQLRIKVETVNSAIHDYIAQSQITSSMSPNDIRIHIAGTSRNLALPIITTLDLDVPITARISYGLRNGVSGYTLASDQVTETIFDFDQLTRSNEPAQILAANRKIVTSLRVISQEILEDTFKITIAANDPGFTVIARVMDIVESILTARDHTMRRDRFVRRDDMIDMYCNIVSEERVDIHRTMTRCSVLLEIEKYGASAHVIRPMIMYASHVNQ